jgi:hypothetical protein
MATIKSCVDLPQKLVERLGSLLDNYQSEFLNAHSFILTEYISDSSRDIAFAILTHREKRYALVMTDHPDITSNVLN